MSYLWYCFICYLCLMFEKIWGGSDKLAGSETWGCNEKIWLFKLDGMSVFLQKMLLNLFKKWNNLTEEDNLTEEEIKLRNIYEYYYKGDFKSLKSFLSFVEENKWDESVDNIQLSSEDTKKYGNIYKQYYKNSFESLNSFVSFTKKLENILEYLECLCVPVENQKREYEHYYFLLVCEFGMFSSSRQNTYDYESAKAARWPVDIALACRYFRSRIDYFFSLD